MDYISEDYVSFETAKLLVEKGFDVSKIDAFFPFVHYSNGNISDDNNTYKEAYEAAINHCLKNLI